MITSIALETIDTRQATSVGGHFDYKVNLSYHYQVDDTQYVGHVIVAGLPNVFSHRTDAESIVQQFSDGENITVFYDPKSPQNSALITTKDVPPAGANSSKQNNCSNLIMYLLTATMP